MKKVRAILIFSWGIWGSSLFIQLNPMFLIKIVPPQKLKKNWGSHGAVGAVFGAIFYGVCRQKKPIFTKTAKATEFEALVLGRCPTFFGVSPKFSSHRQHLKPAWLLALSGCRPKCPKCPKEFRIPRHKHFYIRSKLPCAKLP